MTQSPIEKAKEALRPFAEYYELNDCEEKLTGPYDAIEVPVSDLRRAREALQALEGEGK